MKRLTLLTLAVLALSLLGCGTLTKRLGQAHTAVSGLRQTAKEHFAARCETVARQCPTRLTKRPAEECADLMTCWKQMDATFAAASSAQILISTALSLNGLGKEKEAEAMLPKILQMVLDLKKTLTGYGVLPGGS